MPGRAGRPGESGKISRWPEPARSKGDSNKTEGNEQWSREHASCRPMETGGRAGAVRCRCGRRLLAFAAATQLLQQPTLPALLLQRRLRAPLQRLLLSAAPAAAAAAALGAARGGALPAC